MTADSIATQPSQTRVTAPGIAERKGSDTPS